MSREIVDIQPKHKDSNSRVKTGNEWEVGIKPSLPNSDSDINVPSKKKSKIDKELERLEKLVFGDSSHIFQEEPVPSKKRKKKHTTSDSAFEDSSDVEDSVSLKPAWEDEDDVNTSIQTAHKLQGRPHIEHPGKPNDAYSSLLKRRFENIVGNPKWAEITEHEESDDEDSVLRRCGNFIEKRNYLSDGVLKYDKLKELNCETRCEGKVVKSIEFHPTSTVALIAGLSGIISLVEVDGKNNTKIQTVKFPNFGIHCARFTMDGEQFIIGSKHHRNFYSYDMMTGRSIFVRIPDKSGITKMENFEVSPDGKIIAACGRFGNIYLLSAKTKEVIDSLKMNGDVHGICFNQDGSKLYSHGDEGKVYVWNMNNRSYTHRFADDGCLKGTSICVSPDNQLLACGSSSGIVNLYNTSTALESDEPKPFKILYNLKTAITALKFNHSSELLAFASHKQDKAVRLMHYPSLTVYKNFPNMEKISGIPNCVSFSPQSGYMAIGNNAAKAELYRLNHFGSY